MRLEVLDRLRKDKRYSVKEICLNLGISQSYWYALMSFKRKPGRDLIFRAEDFFGMSYKQIFFPMFSTNRGNKLQTIDKYPLRRNEINSKKVSNEN